MKKKIEINTVILAAYLILFVGIFLWLLRPVVFGPTGLSQSKVPSLSVSRLNEATSLFSKHGKRWDEFPSEPNINNYSFGQAEPI